MTESHASFAGTIPSIYDACLGPLLFEFTGADLAKRVAAQLETSGPPQARVLEIACGTGIATAFLRQRLSPEIEIVATDLNPAMLEHALAHRGDLPNVCYELADAMTLPCDDASFDAVACQFGIMFFPDIARGFAEMRRALRPDGYAICSIWDTLEVNRIAGLAQQTIAEHFDADPPTFLSVPFGSCQPEPTAELMRCAGFATATSSPVDAIIERPSAMDVARGFVEGNPGILEIEARATAGPDAIVAALAERIRNEFGPEPLRIPLRAWVVEGRVTA